MISPRIYWWCTHETLRYEEVPLLIEAGAEVIPSLGDPFWLRYDSNYENENDKLYPHWRKSCTLPTNIVEKIRRIDMAKKKGVVTAEEAELFNHWIDVIFVSSDVNVLANITKWYQGYVVFRVYGHGDYTTYSEQMNRFNINIDNVVSTDKYVWSPILSSLEVPEDSRIVKNKFYLNSFVSEERLGFKWKGKDSEPFISTTISYMDGNPVAREIFESFAQKFSDIPFIVLGKNSKNVVKEISHKILGHVDSKSFYSKIANSRIFVYFGLNSNYHLHFTPIEAIKMGVPVIFLEKSGLAQEARNHGIGNKQLKKIGMCTDTNDIKELVVKIINDLHELEKMSKKQHDVFGKIFSREAALDKTKQFYKKIQPYIAYHRKIEYNKPISINIVKKDCFRSNSVLTDLPTEPGQRVAFSSEGINALSGKLVYDFQGRFIARRVEQGMDSTGIFLGEYIGKMQSGEYLFSVEIVSFKEYNWPIGSFSVGIWNPQYNILSLKNISKLKKGKNIINLAVKISPENSDLLKEMRLVWNGAHTCDVSSMIVEKLI